MIFIVTIGRHQFALKSATKATAVVAALGDAIQVDSDYAGGGITLYKEIHSEERYALAELQFQGVPDSRLKLAPKTKTVPKSHRLPEKSTLPKELR